MIEMDVKKKSRFDKKHGGNRKPQTFRYCAECGELFGPLDRLSRKFCSYKCKVKAQSTGRKTFRKTIAIAKAAQRLLDYYIRTGKIKRAEKCEECGATNKKIEGAHYDYTKPLKVRWLCRSCHIRWDKKNPKNATVIVKRWENYAKKKAKKIN